MEHDEVVLLLGAFALGALDADEHGEVTAHLGECVRCRMEVSRYAQVLRLLGGAAEPHDAA